MRGRITLLLIGFMLFSSMAFSQEKREAKDSLIRLIEASSAQLQEVDGVSYRKIIGPSARFFHNNTYLICDTALWNVNTNVIKALGNVQIIQDNTFLVSDKIDYLVDQNLAQFRGTLVELFDKEGNVLRTNYLDYNTKDSIATFHAGGAMRNSDGNLIESRNGEYRAADKTFSFKDNVQMFTDSVFIKSVKVDYNTVENKAYFGEGTTAWQEDNMLFANAGVFDRPENVFHFNRDSYILTKEQELWADTLSYFRNTGVANLFDNIQILDTVQQAYCFADKAVYNPKPMRVELTAKPSVAMYSVENGVRDTMFLAADTINYYMIRYCDIDSVEVAKAAERIRLSDIDPLKKIEEEAAIKRKENEDALRSPFINGPLDKGKLAAMKEKGEVVPPEIDGVGVVADTSAIAAPADSLAQPVEPVVAAPDTSSVTFIDAWRNVKVFRSDVQALCDSMVYTGIDSMARLYINPVMWNDVKHQFTSDSMQIVLKDNILNKANLITNAFIASQEDSVHFNQIKGTEMVAYFKDNDLYRYDALGGASMIFYVEEDSVITMMNQKEGKIISAKLKERKVERIKYFENLSNNLLPTFGLPLEEQRLRGFNWRGEERPISRFEVTDRNIKHSRRHELLSEVFPDYPFAKVYFTSARDSILNYKAHSDSLRAAKELARIEAQQREREAEKRDSLLRSAHLADSLENANLLADTTATALSDVADSTASADTLEMERNKKISDEIVALEEQIAAKKSLMDSKQQALVPKEQILKLEKEERRRIKKEQALLRKEMKGYRRELKRLEKKLERLEKKKGSR